MAEEILVVFDPVRTFLEAALVQRASQAGMHFQIVLVSNLVSATEAALVTSLSVMV